MKFIVRSIRTYAATLFVVACASSIGLTMAFAQDWPQWGRDQQHTGSINVKGQPLTANLADVVYDSTVAAEQPITGDLLIHYQVPLTDDDNGIYMEFKSGTPDPNTFALMNWAENKLTWQDGTLTQLWSFPSDWKAPSSYNEMWQPVFHAALANGSVYVPGAGGTIFRVNKANGSLITRINPFSTID